MNYFEWPNFDIITGFSKIEGNEQGKIIRTNYHGEYYRKRKERSDKGQKHTGNHGRTPSTDKNCMAAKVREFIYSCGEVTVRQIMEYTGGQYDAIRTTLGRMIDNCEVENIGGRAKGTAIYKLVKRA